MERRGIHEVIRLAHELSSKGGQWLLRGVFIKSTNITADASQCFIIHRKLGSFAVSLGLHRCRRPWQSCSRWTIWAASGLSTERIQTLVGNDGAHTSLQGRSCDFARGIFMTYREALAG
jgi:hypothetical protein